MKLTYTEPVLPVLGLESSYKNLYIQSGDAYDDFESKREALFQYCRLDTLGMVELLGEA